MMMRSIVLVTSTAAACLALPAQAVDADAAQALAKKSNCMKCHAVSAKKETAAKYKGQADAEQKLTAHITTSPKIKVEGKEETHQDVKSKDSAEIRNLVQWILAQ